MQLQSLKSNMQSSGQSPWKFGEKGAEEDRDGEAQIQFLVILYL